MIEERIKRRISHIVVMGIGEPFDNYDNIMKFVKIINDPKGLAIGSRHITISTCGVVPKIYEFSMLATFLISILVILCSIFIVLLIKKKKSSTTTLKDNDKLKYIDAMTSLKNRTYLNLKMKEWDDNVIYPQAFVVIDLNNIKDINDSHGHEEGDTIIKKAASTLIVNQEANTDIIRTDGNEFLVYMVGYSEKDVVNYTRKIYKELKELPYGYGAAIGYSMIVDDVKTVDDAINEATIDMRNKKES